MFHRLGSVRAFSLGPLTLPNSGRRVVAPLLQLAADRDDYDDWYDDFDPSSFDSNEPTTFARGEGGGDRRRGGGYRDGGYRDGGRRDGGYRDGGRRDGGPHDYVRDVQADNSNVDVDTVNALISERLQFRKTGRFDEADAIRDTLLDQHGVRVLDREKMWRSGCSRSGSGRRWGGGSGGDGRRPAQQRRNNNSRRQPRGFGPNGHDYNLSRDAGPNVSSMSEAEIHARIAERLQCKMSRIFRDADAIQMDLEKIGVYIHDGKKEWRADGESYGDYQVGKRGPGRDDRNRPYTQAVASQDTEYKEQIQALVDERTEAKKARAFDVADDIRDELRQLYSVEVDDRSRQWSVGGNFGGGRAAQGKRFDEPKPFSRRGGGSLSVDDLEKISKMLDKRDEAKANRQFGKADKIRDDLREEHMIRIDDRSREWHVVTEEFVMSPEVPMEAEVKESIEQKIKERSVAKLNTEYERADAIRDELWEQYSVRIDDRVREWRVEGDLDDSDDDSESGPFTEENDVTESDVADFQREADQALDSDSVETEDLSDLKVDELKERLRAAGLPVSGKKAELIERLSNK